ncbi:MAG: c-type cytochrome [Limnobacter sp.]|nr:c-type cytochrome [Limnobacter sp.]
MKRWGWALLAAFAVAASIALGWQQIAGSPGGHWIETNDAAVLAQGRDVYARHCASCHGANLEGQPDWTIRLPSGRLPAPPHDASGHTWHHPPDQLFGIVKEGVEKFAPAGYQSNMPAYGSTLSDDEIRSVLAWIRSTWPAEIKRRYAEIQARNR